jgi:hypothetical protein
MAGYGFFGLAGACRCCEKPGYFPVFKTIEDMNVCGFAPEDFAIHGIRQLVTTAPISL